MLVIILISVSILGLLITLIYKNFRHWYYQTFRMKLVFTKQEIEQQYPQIEQMSRIIQRISKQEIPGSIVHFNSTNLKMSLWCQTLQSYYQIQRNNWIVCINEVMDVKETNNYIKYTNEMNQITHFVSLSLNPIYYPNRTTIGPIALLLIDCNLDSRNIRKILEIYYKNIVQGGCVVLNNCKTRDCQKTINDFRDNRDISNPLRDMHLSSIWWQKIQKRNYA